MNDDQYLLASAYLDGELTADQRALAEADPDVMSEVDNLLALRAQLRSIEPPSDSAREAAIGAAMDAFNSIAAARTVPPVDAVTRTVEFRRRPSYARYLGVAAALVAVGLLGLVVATGLRTGDDDESVAFDAASDVGTEAPADEPASEPAAAPADEPAAPAAAELDRAATEADLADDADSAGDTGNFDTADEMAVVGEAPAAESADQAAGEPASEPADEPADDGINTARPVIDPDQPLSTPAELGSFGTYLVELETSGTLGPTPNTACPQQVILAETQYVFDGVPIDVLVAIDDRLRTVTAIDPDTCDALVVGPLF